MNFSYVNAYRFRIPIAEDEAQQHSSGSDIYIYIYIQYKAGQRRLLEGRSRVTLIRESPRGRQAALSKWVSGSRRLLP